MFQHRPLVKDSGLVGSLFRFHARERGKLPRYLNSFAPALRTSNADEPDSSRKLASEKHFWASDVRRIEVSSHC